MSLAPSANDRQSVVQIFYKADIFSMSIAFDVSEKNIAFFKSNDSFFLSKTQPFFK